MTAALASLRFSCALWLGLALSGCSLLPSAYAEEDILVAAATHRAPEARQPLLRPEAPSPAIGSSAGLVLAALLAVGAAAWWRKRKRGSELPAEALELLAQSSLGGRARALWLRADRRNMIVAVTPQAVQVIDRWSQTGDQHDDRDHENESRNENRSDRGLGGPGNRSRGPRHDVGELDSLDERDLRSAAEAPGRDGHGSRSGARATSLRGHAVRTSDPAGARAHHHGNSLRGGLPDADSGNDTTGAPGSLGAPSGLDVAHPPEAAVQAARESRESRAARPAGDVRFSDSPAATATAATAAARRDARSARAASDVTPLTPAASVAPITAPIPVVRFPDAAPAAAPGHRHLSYAQLIPAPRAGVRLPSLRAGVRSGLRAARPSKSRGRSSSQCARGADEDPR